MSGSLHRIRAQWARDDQEGWEVYSVDRWTVRYAEHGRSLDVPVEDGRAPDGRGTITLCAEGLTWRLEDGTTHALGPDDEELVVPRLTAALELLGQLPSVRRS